MAKSDGLCGVIWEVWNGPLSLEKKILSTMFMCLNFNHHDITLVVSLRRMGLKVSFDVEGVGRENIVEKG